MHSGRSRLRTPGAILLLIMLGACDHSAPFEAPDNTTDDPLTDSDPLRLTYGGTAHAPLWLPDDQRIMLSFIDQSRSDGDACLGVIPASGGTLRDIFCHQGALTTDTTDRLDLPAVGRDGQLAFVRYSAPVGAVVDRERWLLVASRDDIGSARKIRSIPFTSDGTLMTSVGSLRWLASGRLAFIANAQTIVLPCDICDPIVVESGRALIVADVETGAPVFTTVPTAGNPTSVAGGSAGDELYYTLAGDSRVYYQAALGAAPAVVHDFGASGIARGVHVSGGRLVATVGGLVTAYSTPTGFVQTDAGGQIWVVDLAGGAAAPLIDAARVFTTPTLSPSGSAVAAMGTPVTIETIYDANNNPIGVDTFVSGPADLWRRGEP